MGRILLSVYDMTGEYGDEQDIDFEQALAAFKKLTKVQLIEWAPEQFNNDPSLFDTLSLIGQATDVSPEKSIAKLRQQIRKITSDRGWQDYWSNSGHIPDYSPVQKQFKKLLRAGHIDVVLELGEELFTFGNVQVSASNNEGETVEELSTCLNIVFEAMIIYSQVKFMSRLNIGLLRDMMKYI